MNIGFLHVGDDARCAELMVRSAKKHGHWLIQMTDRETPPVMGVDEVRRLPWNKKRLMTYRLWHLAQLGKEALILDTDVLVVDATGIDCADVVLTERKGPILDPQGTDVAKLMPFNTGVMYCRNPAFWMECWNRCRVMPEDCQEWYGDQYAVREASEKIKVTALPIDPWNYTPGSIDEDVSQKKLVHYKGKRKEWMAHGYNHLYGTENSGSELAA